MKFRFLTLTLSLVMAMASVSAFAQDAPAIDDEIAALVPALPENGSALEYLQYVQASNNAMKKALESLQASAQSNGVPITPQKAQALAAAFMDRNLEAVNKGLEAPNAPESVFQKLALAKAELLSLKIKLHNDQAAKEEMTKFLNKLQKDGKDTTFKLVAARINAIDAQINAQIFRARIIKAVNTHDAEEMEKLVKEMDEALKNADNGKNATPEMAQNAIMLMFLVQKVPNYRPSEELIPKYLGILSNATNPQTQKVVNNVKAQIAAAIKAAQEKKRQEEEQKKQEEENNQNEKVLDLDNLM
ncbi:MAG: hypothetical protein IJQ39_13080 [Thermoguttaceae bacterium]|nr:hypothetical protein [Thermoguttaceae bacterium]